MLNRRQSPVIQEVTRLVLPTPQKVALDNGIPVYLMDYPDQDIVKVEVVFNCGRAEETKRLTSRATARMLREGSRLYTAAEMAELIDFYGGTVSAPAGLDTSNFVLYSLKKYADELIPLFAHMVLEPAFPEAELETFKETSTQELLLDLDKEEVLAYRQITELIFGESHPYGYNSVLENYLALTPEDLFEYHRNWYTPANCLIFASGHADARVLELLNKNFGAFRREGPTRVEPTPPPMEPSGKVHMKHPGSLQTAIKIGQRMFGRKHPDYNGLFVLNTILGGYFGSRLMTNIREKRGFTYNIYSTLDAMQHDGCMYIATEVNNGKKAVTIRHIKAEMQALCDEPVPEEELSMVRNYLLGMLLNGLDGPLNSSDVVKSLVVDDLPLEEFDNLVFTIRNITAEQLMLLARRYLRPETYLTVTVG